MRATAAAISASMRGRMPNTARRLNTGAAMRRSRACSGGSLNSIQPLSMS